MTMKNWPMITVFVLGVLTGGGLLYYLGGINSDGTRDGDQPPAETNLAVLLQPAPMDEKAPAGTPRHSLADAQAEGLIRVETVGRNASSGDALVIAVERLTDHDIDIYVAPGTIFLPSGGDVQRMVAWGVVGAIVSSDSAMQPTTSMYLPTPEPRVFIVEAYCLDFTLENPTVNDLFRVQTAPHARAAQIIHEGKRTNMSIKTIQSAIWIEEDHLTKQEIQTKFDASDQEIEDAFEMLKRTPRRQPQK
ncbi:MAG: hypothetical protein NTX84_08545 [Nitrospirae bacterium]|nr:hypothetical protein [Nitrospirota bacterium]